MKKYIICLLLIFTISFIACVNNKVLNDDDNIELFHYEKAEAFLKEHYGFEIDNKTPINRLSLDKYKLNEIQGYFNSYPTMDEEEAFYGGSKYDTFLMRCFGVVNEKFPVKIVRSCDDYVNYYYTVYKIKEGGYFYIFWLFRDICFADGGDITDLYAVNTFYINDKEQPSLVDFFKSDIKTLDDIISDVDINGIVFASRDEVKDKSSRKKAVTTWHTTKEDMTMMVVYEPLIDIAVDENDMFIYESRDPSEYRIDYFEIVDYDGQGGRIKGIQKEDYPEGFISN